MVDDQEGEEVAEEADHHHVGAGGAAPGPCVEGAPEHVRLDVTLRTDVLLSNF